MPDPKKPTAIEQMVEILKSMVTEPISDQSSRPPTPADVRHVKAALNPPAPRKAAKKKPAAKKTPVAKKKPVARKKRAATVKRRKTARK